MAGIESDVLLGGRYRLVQRLAAGGMGTVWEAEDTVLHRRVAVKVLSDTLSANEQFIERFRREARSAAGLSHPNVAGIFDYGVDDDTHFIVMELIDGETLASRLTKGPLPWSEAVRITESVADALDDAHRHGVVHRDVKPGNIMLTDEGGVKVMDFGIAAAASAPQITASGTTMGTATYIAPEQAAGHRATPASDVYSLGVVLYEMLAGRPPFTGSSPVAVAAMHVQDEPPSLRSLAPDVPEHVAAACHAALAKDPAGRPPSAHAFATMLRSPGPATAPMPVAPKPGPEGEPTRVLTPPAGTAVLPQARAGTGTPPLGVPVQDRVGEADRRGPPRRTWLGALLGALAAVAAIVIALALILKGPGPTTPAGTPTPTATGSATVTVPKLAGLSLDDAKSVLKAANLKVGPVVKVAGPDGIVVKTDPSADKLVPAGSSVTLYVGSAPPKHGHGKGDGKGNGGGEEG